MDTTSTTTEATETQNILNCFDAIYVDASSWMTTEMETFLQEAAPILRSSDKKLIMIADVQKELENCATLKYAAQTALRLREQYADIIHCEPGEAGTGTADGEFVRLFFFNHRKRNQLLITHDQQLTADIQNCCGLSADEREGTAVMTIWPDGDLITFAEMTRRKNYQARMRLAEMVGNSPLFIDSGTLAHENLAGFLDNIAEPMMAQDKQVQLVSNSITPELEPIVAACSESHPNLLQIVPTEPTLSETDALLGELYLNPANMGTERLILVTDDVARANELRTRRPKCDRFPYVDFMTINKYGFLSFLKLSDTAPTQQDKFRPRFTPYQQTSGPRTQDRKPSAFVPQLIGAIKNEDIDSMCAYIEKGANRRNGIITSLCQSKDSCLRVLIEKAEDNIEPATFEWWVCCYYSFENPAYLAENDEHYALLQMLVSKSAPLTDQHKAMTVLADRVSSPDGAHERLWNIIRLALRNGAPEAVYSHETGETLPEIARRQGNEDMLNFLQSR